jgi:glycosyltransferase involved in cell wall biosynthesis
MRIGINGLFLQYPSTGTGQYLTHLLRTLPAAGGGHDYQLFAPPGAPTGFGPGILARAWRARLPGRADKVWQEQAGFPRFCRREEVAVAHVPHFAAPLWSPCPVVVTIHDLTTFIFPEYAESLAARGYNALVAAGARRAAVILADSEHTRGDVVKRLGVSKERVQVVYLAAESRFAPVRDATALAEMRHSLGLPERYLYYIGGLNRHKNLGGLLEAYKSLASRLPDAPELVIAGRAQSDNPRVFPDLPARARELGLADRVRFLGHVAEEDKHLLYAAAELFVFPSLYEGFGLPPLEAMACGTPVVCSAAASLPEVVGTGDIGGLLVDASDPGALAGAMQAVLTSPDLQARLRAAGPMQAARFSWERTAAETMKAYERAAGGTP